jgi:hypothetical protein
MPMIHRLKAAYQACEEPMKIQRSAEGSGSVLVQ